MRLQSTPKPVRFRISSGGQEHSSLESLLSCFDYNELRSLKSQLIQWLERQGPKGNEIAIQLDNCDSMPSFEDTIKLFYGYDCETMIKNWCETKSRNLRFINLDIIKTSQNLLAIAYKNKDVFLSQVTDSQWLDAINCHIPIENIDLLNIKTDLAISIETERLRALDQEKKRKKIEETRTKTEETIETEPKNTTRRSRDIVPVQFKLLRYDMNRKSNWRKIATITGFTENQLEIFWSRSSWSSTIYLTDLQINKLTPLVEHIIINGENVK